MKYRKYRIYNFSFINLIGIKLCIFKEYSQLDIVSYLAPRITHLNVLSIDAQDDIYWHIATLIV